MSDRPPVHVLGVRHHGPGSARAVLAALDAIRPAHVLVEGPADADPLLHHLTDPGLHPPVALLGYAADEPGRSAFWPLARFSPEWQALTWAAGHGARARFIDLPAAAVLAEHTDQSPPDPAPEEPAGPAPDDLEPDGPVPGGPGGDRVRSDPIAVLAHTAGYEDPEAWWDDIVELRRPTHRPAGDAGPGPEADPVDPVQAALAPFLALTEAMTELRAARAHTHPPGDDSQQVFEERREAHMRKVLRETVRHADGPVVVVCGAWHAPALQAPLPPAGPDTKLLTRLPRRKATLTWVPWTHSRLSFHSGYGAGVDSPGWYAHLFEVPHRTVPDWLTRVAAALRQRDLPVSSAHVIEAVRLADTLAVLRGRPAAGLTEVQDATLSVVCEGNRSVLDVVTADLVVGEALGQIPDTVPTVPLETDLAAATRTLRLPRDPQPTAKDLDLRRPRDLQRSALLHRLRLLGIDWGQPVTAHAGTGTFRESWNLQWRPELAVAVIDAAVWGTTVAAAARARTRHRAADADLTTLAGLVQQALLADLGDALPDLLTALDAAAAHDHDITVLMRAVPPLADAHRYGDVRGTDTGRLGDVLQTLLDRICAGLPGSAAGLDAGAAEDLRTDLLPVEDAVARHEDPALRQSWSGALQRLADRPDTSPLLAGLATRLLLRAGRLDTAQAGQAMGLALSHGPEPARKAAWVEGFLSGSGSLVVHDRDLLTILDTWVSSLRDQEFLDVLPLLRRTFATFETAERRGIGQAVTTLAAARPTRGPAGAGGTVNRAAMVVAAGLLGLHLTGDPDGSGPDA